jgi:hypothetical protein
MYYCRIILLLVVVQLNRNYVEAQNLVINPGFEDTIPCVAFNGAPMMHPMPWFMPTTGSPDYFCTQFTSCNFGGIPNNGFGYQLANGQNSYVGFGVYAPAPYYNFREYVTGTLSDSLETGKRYCVSFYVSFANNEQFYTDDIGAYFCTDTSTLVNYSTNQVLNVIPQVENLQGNMLSDTLNWMLISGSFIAQGGEKFITIGNFRNDANTTVLINPSGFDYASYYYLDDVSVTDCTVGLTEVSADHKLFVIFPNPAKDIFNIKMNDNSIIKGGSEMKLFDVIGKAVLQQKLEGNSTKWELDINKLPDGIYFVQLLNHQGTLLGFSKLVVQ